MDQGKQTKEKAEKLAAMKKLSTSKELFVLMSLCTKMPFVMCDPETIDDEVFLYEKEEDIKREGQRFLDQKIPLQIAKIDNKQFLHFYSNLFTMGVNCLVFNGYMEDEYKLQLADLVNRPGQNLKEGQIWVENPGLHLTALYFMQEVRRQKFEKLPKELQELQEEILADYGKGTYLAPFNEENGVPLLKQQNGDSYQPIFTDMLEFNKFNRENFFKASVMTADKITGALAKGARGVVVNPMGVNLQLPITKRAASGPAKPLDPAKLAEAAVAEALREPEKPEVPLGDLGNSGE